MKAEGYLKESYHYFHLKDSAGQERDFHYHEFDKIVILLTGDVVYAVEDQTYTLHPWDVLLVKHHCIHKAVISKTTEYQRVILYLDGKYFDRAMPQAGLMAGFDRADRCCSYRFAPDERERRELEGLIQQYEAAQADTRVGSDTVRELIVMGLLDLRSQTPAGAVLHQRESHRTVGRWAAGGTGVPEQVPFHATL